LTRTVLSSRSCSNNEVDSVEFIGRHLALLLSRFKSQRDVYEKSEQLTALTLLLSMTGVNSFFKFTNYLMARKKTRLTNLDASVLEAQMRCGTEWPIGLVEAIAKAHQTSVRCVIARKRALRATGQHNPEFNINLSY